MKVCWGHHLLSGDEKVSQVRKPSCFRKVPQEQNVSNLKCAVIPDLWQIYCFAGRVKFTAFVFRKLSAQPKAL